jgi:predicted transcriptional regulator
MEVHGEIIESKEGIRSLNRTGSSVPDSDMVWRDIRANKFAAELLMPLEQFIKIWDKSSNIEEVAEKFNVSPYSAKLRAETLLGQIVEQ